MHNFAMQKSIDDEWRALQPIIIGQQEAINRLLSKTLSSWRDHRVVAPIDGRSPFEKIKRASAIAEAEARN